MDKPIWKTTYLILHGILPTIDRLARWGIEPRNPLCHCGQPETQEHLLEHCPLTLILVDWFEQLLGHKWPIASRTHTSGLVIQPPLGFQPDSSFSWQLCDITFGSLGIRGNLRVLIQIPKCWSRRSSLLSGLSRRYNSKFWGRCCSFHVGHLLLLSLRAHSSHLWSVSFLVRSARWSGNRPCYLACNR